MHDALYPLLLVLLTSTLLLGSCGLTGSDDSREPQGNGTYLRAKLNGEDWSAEKVEANLFKHMGSVWLSVFGKTLRSQHYETLGVTVIFEGTGTYPLIEEKYEEEFNTRYTGSRFHETELDVLIASYSPTNDASANQLTITSYDSTTGIMTGTFRTTVVVDENDRVSEPSEPPRLQPDTLRFTGGAFRVKVNVRR